MSETGERHAVPPRPTHLAVFVLVGGKPADFVGLLLSLLVWGRVYPAYV